MIVHMETTAITLSNMTGIINQLVKRRILIVKYQCKPSGLTGTLL